MHNILKTSIRSTIVISISSWLISCGGSTDNASQTLSNTYIQNAFVSNNSSKYQSSIATDPAFIDAWGIAIRPAGQPGHFWVLAGNKSYEYVGDVSGKVALPCTTSSLCPDLAPLLVNTITFPDFPLDAFSNPDIINNHATGTVFNGQATSFVISQIPSPISRNTAPITGGSKFLFATNYGAIYAWTERKHTDGSGYDRSDSAVKVFDTRHNPNDCGQFYGLAISPNSDRLYAADFGTNTSSICNNAAAIAGIPKSFKVRVFDKTLQADGTLKEITKLMNGGKPFPNPFVPDSETVKAGDYAPWNVQVIGSSVFVAYVQVQQDPHAPVGTPLPANEVHAPSAGRLAEFDLNGRLIAVWNDGGLLNAPWGLVLAPSNFGGLSNTLLVGNFGDFDTGGSKGAIVAFDLLTRKALNYIRNKDGSPMLIPGIWGMTFGNGDTLGDSNALYFASGPNGERDGLFGSLRYSAP